MTLYRIDPSDGSDFIVHKLDVDLNPKAVYHITGKTCDCPAGHRPICRHRQMLMEFKDLGRIGTGWLYDYDYDEWHEPINVENWND